MFSTPLPLLRSIATASTHRLHLSTTTLGYRMMSTATANDGRLPSSSIPIFETVAAYRKWRNKVFLAGKSVGFVPTMGALHTGHLSLVKKSLAENDLTVVSIFVNPTQFAPHEDLATYPRTLPRDLALLEAQHCSIHPSRTPNAVFLPTVHEMYPSGISQDPVVQKGAFVEVKGYGHQMEGKSRPTFFRGVATVVTKLFGAIQPTRAYFGQKDIQQALLLRRLCRDLLMAHPEAQNVIIVPTERDVRDGLALSSRNVYLSPEARAVAPVLYSALQEAEHAWGRGAAAGECVRAAEKHVELRRGEAHALGLDVEMKLDYVDMNDAETFDAIEPSLTATTNSSAGILLSGALWVDQTRLIDNIILGNIDQAVEHFQAL